MSRPQDPASDARVRNDPARRDGESLIGLRPAIRLSLATVIAGLVGVVLTRAFGDVATAGSFLRGSVLQAVATAVIAGPLVQLWLVRPIFGRLDALNRNVAVEASRQQFEGQLRRAFEMAVDEPGAIEVARRAVSALMPGCGAELLLSDSSDAHLTRVMMHGDRPEAPGCQVASPWACPAVVSGRTRVFPDATALDACPQLLDRAVPAAAAACLPVTSMGRALGVLHVVVDGPDQLPVPVVERLRMLAGQAGHGIGTRRSFDRTQVQASTDPLTGLLNRRSLEDRATTLLASVTHYSVVLLDLDEFKQLNDVHGHEAGDRAIRAMGQVLKRCVRDCDLAGRYGGDEFVLVLPGTDEPGAMVVAERVRQSLAAAPMGPGPALAASLGVAAVEHGVPLADALRMADHAMLEVKRTGRGRVLSAVSLPSPRPEVAEVAGPAPDPAPAPA